VSIDLAVHLPTGSNAIRPLNMSIGNARFYAALGLLLLLAICGCVSTPTPPPSALAPPSVLAETRTYSGTPLSGPLATDASSLTPTSALGVKVTFFALEKMPKVADEPLGPHVRLIVASRENSPVLASARLTLGVRLIELDKTDDILANVNAGKYGRSALIATFDGALLPAATTAFSLAEPPSQAGSSSDQTNRRIELDFCPQSKSVEAAILMDDFLDLSPPREIEEAFIQNRPPPTVGRAGIAAAKRAEPSEPPVFQSELAIFDRPAARNAFALLAPIQFGNSESHAVIAIVEISPGRSDPAFQKLIAQAIWQIQQSSQTAAQQAAHNRAEAPDWPGLSSAVEALAWSSRQRTGLLYLAQQTSASATEDVVLAADDSIVSRLADSVRNAIAAAPDARDRKSVGWILERSTYELLLQIQSGGKLPPELASILALRTGQAGRNAGTLEEVLDNTVSQQDMVNRLAAENYIFLEDSSPSARVRAFDWLAAQNLAPANFDPLASAKERRQALDQAEQTAAK
jgi:hypothetical protein